MSRVSGCLWLGVALILALVAGGVAFVTLQKATVTRAQGDAPVAMTSVVVAAHPLPVGTLLSEKDLTLQTLPTGSLPAGVIAGVADAAGQLTTSSMEAGEMVLAHHLTHPDITGDNLAFTLPEGLVAVSLSADDLLSSLSLVQVGDRVDILYSLRLSGEGGPDNATNTGQYSFGSLQNVTVVSVARTSAKESADASTGSGSKLVPTGAAKAYILGLSPQDALVLKYLKDAGAVMDLALRNVADESEHTAQPINEQYLIDRFQLMTR
jgi:pilus assembly protein CpaB